MTALPMNPVPPVTATVKTPAKGHPPSGPARIRPCRYSPCRPTHCKGEVNRSLIALQKIGSGLGPRNLSG